MFAVGVGLWNDDEFLACQAIVVLFPFTVGYNIRWFCQFAECFGLEVVFCLGAETACDNSGISLKQVREAFAFLRSQNEPDFGKPMLEAQFYRVGAAAYLRNFRRQEVRGGKKASVALVGVDLYGELAVARFNTALLVRVIAEYVECVFAFRIEYLSFGNHCCTSVAHQPQVVNVSLLVYPLGAECSEQSGFISAFEVVVYYSGTVSLYLYREGDRGCPYLDFIVDVVYT